MALVILLIGVLYLGQYQRGLIEAKLETFEAEVELVSAALSEGAVIEYERPGSRPFAHGEKAFALAPEQARRMVRRLSQTKRQRILLFDATGTVIADSSQLVGPGALVELEELEPVREGLYSVEILKSIAGLILKFLPDRKILLRFPQIEEQTAQSYPDAAHAIEGKISMSAWQNPDENGMLLTAASPLIRKNEIIGAVMLMQSGQQIEEDIGQVWLNIVKIFAITLIITIMLSIYLSGVIARPLRKLARAADAVRKGQSKDTEIPDLSYRHDEIGELSIVLRDMTNALWARMDSIERFAADVAHELKNPLTSLRSAVETAAIVKKQADRDKLMNIIQHDIQRLDRLITDISSASRLDAELSRLPLQEVDLRKLLWEMISVYKDPLKRKESTEAKWNDEALHKGVHIRLSSTLGPVYVWGLEGQLEQVFRNLLGNALSFAPPDSKVEIRVAQLRRRIAVTVEDEGPGIPEGKLETVFERFYSERPQHEDYGQHSGLGLSICRQIINALNGEIFADNIRDPDGAVKGARFTVVLNQAKH